MKRNGGFTLIEIIVVMVLMGIMAAGAGMAVVQITRGYVFMRDNTVISEKAQLAMDRITREILEMTGITADATATFLPLKNVEGNRDIGLFEETLRVVPEGGDLSQGDILVEDVGVFALTYWSRDGSGVMTSSTGWSMGSDITLLAAIDIDLQLNREDGGTLTFRNRVAPRNNKNQGGAPPGSPPPVAPNYGCFIATVAHGNEKAPAGGSSLPFNLVLLLLSPVVLSIFVRERDRRGKIPPGGRPSREKGVALLGIVFVMIVTAALAAAVVSMVSSSLFGQVQADQGRKAYFLAESGFRYGASEFLNAGSESAKLAVMDTLDGKTCHLSGGGGSFSLRVYPYWFLAQSAAGSTLTAGIHGTFSPAMDIASGGYLKIGSFQSNSNFYSYGSGSHSGSTVTFTTLSPNPAVTAGDEVRPAAVPSGTQTVTEKGNLTLAGTGTGAFPPYNGNFILVPPPPGTAAGTVYNYQMRSGNTLQEITLADASKTWANFTVSGGDIGSAATTKVVMDKFLRLSSTGTVGDGRREVIYNVPVGWIAGGEGFKKEEYVEPFNTLANWSGPSGGETFGGTHSNPTVDGDTALKVESAPYPSVGAWWSGAGRWAAIFLNWGNTNANLAQSWLDTGGLLSYDLQVKMRANGLKYFMGGINFRIRNAPGNTDLYAYGVSFIKPRQTRYRFLGIGNWSSWSSPQDLSTNLIPGYVSDDSPGPLFSGTLETSRYWQLIIQYEDRYGLPAIVLWQRTASGFRWLAYRTLSTADGIIQSVSGNGLRLQDWSTLGVRVVEGCLLPFAQGTSRIRYYAEAGPSSLQGSTSGATARVNGTPLLTGGSWGGGNAEGFLTICNVEGSFGSNEFLEFDGTICARTAGTISAGKSNYIRAYYGRTNAQGTANAVQTDNNRLADARGAANWPPDDAGDRASSNDFYTLVQWTGFNSGIAAVTSLTEPNAVIGTSDLVSPGWTSGSTASDFSPSESVGLVTSTENATSTYYDDFAIQLDLKAGTGFLPPIQQ